MQCTHRCNDTIDEFTLTLKKQKQKLINTILELCGVSFYDVQADLWRLHPQEVTLKNLSKCMHHVKI